MKNLLNRCAFPTPLTYAALCCVAFSCFSAAGATAFAAKLTGSPAAAAATTTPPTKPAAAVDKLVTLGLIDGENDDKMPSITLRLDHAPEWDTLGELQDHGSFLQLILPGTLVPEPGKFFEGVKPFLPKIAVFQLTPSDAGIRFFVSTDAAKVKEFTHAEILGNRIVLTLDQAKLKEALAQADMGTELVGPPAPGAMSAEQVIARTEVHRDDAVPSDLVKKDKASRLTSGNDLDLRDKLLRATLFSIAMLVFLGGSWLAKPYLRKRRALAAAVAGGELPSEPLSIKTLASLSVAARQKVSLIQVGGERFLIGVTPEHVSFLTTIGQTPGVPTMAQAAQPLRLPSKSTGAPRDLSAAAASLSGGQVNFNQALDEADDSGATLTLKQSSQAPPRPTRRDNAPSSRTSGYPQNAERRESGERPSPRGQAPSPEGGQLRQKRQTGSRINIGVSEDGVQDFGPSEPRRRAATQDDDLTPSRSQVSNTGASNKSRAADGDGQKAIDDVTRLIREKLKNLRTI